MRAPHLTAPPNAAGMLTLDLTYIGIQGYPNFNTFLGSMLISFQVGKSQAGPVCR